MFNLNGVVVSGCHIVKHKSAWIAVREHPDAIRVLNYTDPYLYCINTSTKIIRFNSTIFTDWDEIYDETLTTVLNSIPIKTCENIHKYLDVGFDKDMLVDLVGDTNKKIKDINTATQEFVTKYEMAGKPMLTNRKALAQNILSRMLSSKTSNNVTPKTESNKTYYTVKSGDSLSKIAAQYDSSVTVDTIKKLNNLSSDSITPDQVLRIK
jgi:LysM repeat protein